MKFLIAESLEESKQFVWCAHARFVLVLTFVLDKLRRRRKFNTIAFAFVSIIVADVGVVVKNTVNAVCMRLKRFVDSRQAIVRLECVSFRTNMIKYIFFCVLIGERNMCASCMSIKSFHCIRYANSFLRFLHLNDDKSSTCLNNHFFRLLRVENLIGKFTVSLSPSQMWWYQNTCSATIFLAWHETFCHAISFTQIGFEKIFY